MQGEKRIKEKIEGKKEDKNEKVKKERGRKEEGNKNNKLLRKVKVEKTFPATEEENQLWKLPKYLIYLQSKDFKT